MPDPEQKLHRNAVRAQEAIRSAGLDAEVRVLADSARTVAEAASGLGVTEGQIAKSLVFLADNEPVVVVTSGERQVDTKRLADHLNAKRVSRADADRVRAATGYPIGGVSPAGLSHRLRVVIDASLERFDVVWAAAGTHHAVFPSTYKDLLKLTGGEPGDVSVASV